MKSSPLFVLCVSSLIALHAESPILEESSPSPDLHYELASKEDTSLQEELLFLDEESDDFDEELSSAEEWKEKNESLSLEIKTDKTLPPLIDSAKPLENIQPNLSFRIMEESKPADIKIADSIKEEPPASLPESSLSENRVLRNPEIKPSLQEDSPAILTIESSSSDIKNNLDVQLDLKRAFVGSPFIYTLLFGMSMFSVFIWLYSLLALKKTARVPQQLIGNLHSNLNGNHFDEALSLCNSQDALLCKMVASGIQSRKYGLSAMIESMKAEGKRSSMNFWQKIGLLNDIAILAPMLGLLGTVLGMFYAFYDVNRSIESITSLFDGLGISVGTTVAGLIVAILALILHSTAKYRLIRVLSQVESEAHGIASLIDSHVSLYEESK